MEDFTGAYIERRQDTEILYEKQRIVALHLGGVAIECRLKSLLSAYHQISDWDEKSQRQKCSMFNQHINNPGHSLMTAMRHMPDLWRRAKSNAEFLKHLNHIIYPLGATSIDYINLRYVSQIISKEQSEKWKKSFDYVCAWLEKNKGVTL
ncbi:MAG: hypothetical protein ACO3EZ_08845 [Prochlorotrichaceae cyanobacterium]